jgi:outer membrane protein TolC
MADVEAASARVTALRHLLVARANRALLHAVGYAAVARRLADEDALLSSAAASIQTEFAVGKSTYVDVLRLRTERLRVQTERSTALARAQAGRATFEALVPPGSPGRAEALSLLDTLVAHGAVRSLLALLPPAPDVDSVLQVSGALQIANAAVRRAEAQRSLMLAQQHPQFSASLGVQRFTGDQGGATLGPVFGGSISLPFTARNANRTALAAADLELAAATAERTAARATLRADLMAARELYENALEHLAIYDTALLQAAAQEREGALASFRAGQLTLTVLLDFERGLSAAMTDRLQSEVDAADALDQLLTATWTAGAPATSSSRP